jgi:hypothetical protein
MYTFCAGHYSLDFKTTGVICGDNNGSFSFFPRWGVKSTLEELMTPEPTEDWSPLCFLRPSRCLCLSARSHQALPCLRVIYAPHPTLWPQRSLSIWISVPCHYALIIWYPENVCWSNRHSHQLQLDSFRCTPVYWAPLEEAGDLLCASAKQWCHPQPLLYHHSS